MRNRLLAGIGAVSLAVALAIVALPAQAADVRADVPFSFAVNGETLAPGSYKVSLAISNGVLEVKSLRRTAFVMVNRGTVDGETAPKLVFHRYGDLYLLREAWLDGQSWELPEPYEERELARAGRLASMEVVEVPVS